ncbi:MAG: hypothetical protein GIW95_07240 [Candidatus Eremiobacteraeota bacterium]|nr:hypothetical protein [Candidatus Eremiobacteraeota bacterium]
MVPPAKIHISTAQVAVAQVHVLEAVAVVAVAPTIRIPAEWAAVQRVESAARCILAATAVMQTAQQAAAAVVQPDPLVAAQTAEMGST